MHPPRMKWAIGPDPGGLLEKLQEHLRKIVTASSTYIPQATFIYSTRPRQD